MRILLAWLWLGRVWGADFTVLLMPDTQYYTESYPEIYRAQTAWIRDHAAWEKIAFVIHLGDITENNTEGEWEVASGAMGMLDGKVPYSVLPGNHDGFSSRNPTPSTAMYRRYFPASRFARYPWFGGSEGDNSYFLFRAGGMEFLVVNLRFGPTDEDLRWADGVLKRYPKRKAIVATHAYLYHDNTRLGPGDDYSPKKRSAEYNDGEEIWEKLIRRHANVFLVVSGHVYGTGRLTSRGDQGNEVHQILADYQKFARGGDGWLRFLRFDVRKGEIEAKTYSPTRDEYLTSPEHDFVLPFPRQWKEKGEGSGAARRAKPSGKKRP